jgi:hypothetical protein
VNDTESFISQYVNDTFLVLDGCETSLRETLICFENFYKASGLKINTSKTRVVWVGSKRYSNQILCNIFETSIIFVLKFRSGIELRSREKSIPSSLKLNTDQSNVKSGKRI